jgi:hypothetical protein
MPPSRTCSYVLLALIAFSASALRAQAPPAAPIQTPADSQASPEPRPALEPPPGASGTVLFSRDLTSNAEGTAKPADPAATPGAVLPGKPDPLQVSDAERKSLTVTSYDLDVHVAPASSSLSSRSTLAVRNDGPAPLSRLILQISSTLHWDGISLARPSLPLSKLTYTSRLVATDTDHTGWVAEAVITLPKPLPPGESLLLATVYSGAIPPSSERLERIGAPQAQARSADWDAISELDAGTSSVTPVALRGFGNVLWYPVSTPITFLGDGARLFQLVGSTKLREQEAHAALRLSVEFAGDPPDAAFFCGRTASFKVVHDDPDAPVASGSGVAMASFDARPLGFRPVSLFVTTHPATMAGTASQPDLIAAVTDRFDTLKGYTSAAEQVTPLLSSWLGQDPLTPLHLLDHSGEPFEDDALLVSSLSSRDSKEAQASLAATLTHSLTHAWFHSDHPWIEEGLAQFMGLLWIEQSAGRPAALDRLQDAAHALALVEPAPGATQDQASLSQLVAPAKPPGSSGSSSSPSTANEPAATPTGEPLVNASSEVFYRAKAAAVWWMLRAFTGDDALKQALHEYRLEPALDRDPKSLERTLERVSHQDLRWFFEDWVYHDRGLPDLTVVNVTPRQIEGRGGQGSWLISIEVRNDGDAVADVPVTVRSDPGLSGASAAAETQRLRIPGHSSVSRRIVFPVTPSEVQVNDGSVPETRVSIHKEHLSTGTP